MALVRELIVDQFGAIVGLHSERLQVTLKQEVIAGADGAESRVAVSSVWADVGGDGLGARRTWVSVFHSDKTGKGGEVDGGVESGGAGDVCGDAGDGGEGAYAAANALSGAV